MIQILLRAVTVTVQVLLRFRKTHWVHFRQ